MTKIVVLAFTFFSLVSYAQIVSEKRIEFDQSESTQIISTYPIGKRGLIALEKELPAERGEVVTYSLSKYSIDLEKIGTEQLEIPKRVNFKKVVTNKDTSVIVLLIEDRQNWIFKIVETNDLVVSEHSYPKPKTKFKEQFSLVTTFDSKIYFAGYVDKVPSVMTFNYETGEQNFFEIPGENPKRIIENFELTEDKEHIVVFQRDGRDMKSSAFTVVPMSFEGVFESPIVLDKDPQYAVVDGSVNYQVDGTMLITGTYSTVKNSRATGFYFAKFFNDRQEFIQYYSFSDFKNFFDFLPDNKQKKVEKRAAKKEEKGLTDYVATLVALHPVITGNGFYRIVGEAFYPTYRTETSTTYVNGRSTTTTRQVFDGYQYTHAAVIDVDLEGNKIQDFCFTMLPWRKPMTVTKFLKITTDAKGNSRIMMLDYKLYSTEISENHEMTVHDPINLYEEKEGEKLKFSNIFSSNYWYGNNYVLLGITKVKNENEADRKKRTTVTRFMEKVSYL